MNGLISVKEVCAELQLSREHVRKLRQRKADPLPCMDLGGVIRFDPVAVAAWLERQRLAPLPVPVPRPRRQSAAPAGAADRLRKFIKP